MNTPREGSLYRQIAKDYTPKQAEMKICKYIESLERRIEALEQAKEVVEPEEAKSKTRARRGTTEATEGTGSTPTTTE